MEVKDGTGLRVALGALAGLGMGAIGVLVLPPLLVPDPDTLGPQAAALLPEPSAIGSADRTQESAPPGSAPGTDASAPPTIPSETAAVHAGSIPEATAEAPSAASAEVSPVSSEAGPALAHTTPTRSEPDPIAPATGVPGFDTVRLEPDGSGLVAGRAEPGAAVTVLADDQPVAEAEADADGRFVAFLSLAPSDAPRALSLRDAEGRASEATVILAPTASAEAVAALDPAMGNFVPPADSGEAATRDLLGAGPALPPGPADTSGPLSSVIAEGQPSAAPTSGPEAVASPPEPGPALAATSAAPSSPDPSAVSPEIAAAAPPLAGAEVPVTGQSAVLLSDAEGVRVLQPPVPPGADPEVLATVALDAIAYDGTGEVVLSGRGTGGTVRLYLDNRPVGDAVIGPDGQWTAPLPDAQPGTVHTLRLDQIGPSGEVLSRIETPFRREDRAALAAALSDSREPGRTAALRIVQPGNTLWAIARDRYDEPLLYVRLFEANRDRIRDPDLIYPGQVFLLPDIDLPDSAP